MTDQTAKKRKNKVLRRNEYYAIQDVFDGLYVKRGMHNYYCVASRVSKDFWGIYFHLLKTLKHITRSHGKIGPPLSEFQKRRHGNTVYDMRVHKIYPNGGDGYRNIDIVSRDAYELIHTTGTARAKELMDKLASEGLWNEKSLKKTNNYRILVGNTIIE